MTLRRSAPVQAGQQGMTLVELMVAMTIGLFLVGGALFVYSQSKNTYRAGDSLARLQETARFAMDTLEPDLRLARFWGRSASPGRITTAPGIIVRCDGTDVTDWALDLQGAVEVRDDTYDLDCASFRDDPRPGSDVLVVRHAEPWTGGAPPAGEAGRLQVSSNLRGGQVFNDGNPRDLGPDTSTHNVVINAYYVSQQSSFDPTLPSLRRLTLRADGTVGEEEVIPGVENLQVQLGMDTDRDGDVDRYVDGDHPLVTPGAAGFDAGARVAAVRLWMLVGTPADDQAWVDQRLYPTPDADLGDLAAGTAGYPASNRRIQISKTIFLNNQDL